MPVIHLRKAPSRFIELREYEPGCFKARYLAPGEQPFVSDFGSLEETVAEMRSHAGDECGSIPVIFNCQLGGHAA